MTLDEAIKMCNKISIEALYDIEDSMALHDNDSIEKFRITRENHQQLAEWLTELKQWRRVYGICPSYEMCIPECREGYDAQIAEYKRLLKAAVEDIHKTYHHRDECCDICKNKQTCTINCAFVWQHEAEALKLLNDEK